MSVSKVIEYLKKQSMDDRVIELEKSSATVELAAIALNTQPERIAKTLSFLVHQKPIVVVCAGDAKVDNRKFKEYFNEKARMIPYESVEEYTGHAPGGVCPFALNQHVEVYLDISMQRFDIIYPAAGDDHSAVKLTNQELEVLSNSLAWIDVCKDWS